MSDSAGFDFISNPEEFATDIGLRMTLMLGNAEILGLYSQKLNEDLAANGEALDKITAMRDGTGSILDGLAALASFLKFLEKYEVDMMRIANVIREIAPDLTR